MSTMWNYDHLTHDYRIVEHRERRYLDRWGNPESTVEEHTLAYVTEEELPEAWAKAIHDFTRGWQSEHWTLERCRTAGPGSDREPYALCRAGTRDRLAVVRSRPFTVNDDGTMTIHPFPSETP